MGQEQPYLNCCSWHVKGLLMGTIAVVQNSRIQEVDHELLTMIDVDVMQTAEVQAQLYFCTYSNHRHCLQPSDKRLQSMFVTRPTYEDEKRQPPA